ncbi:MAG TPA: PAS domain S-box protein [Chitinophagaceae bacterium]|nr:PAS domain S-box protein [Chitinophagaceae bacterium]
MTEITPYLQSADLALHPDYNRLHALIASFDDMVVEMDEHTRVLNIWTNNSDLLFQPIDHYMGKTILESFPGAFGNELTSQVMLALQSGRILNWEFPSPQTGSNRWFRARINPWDKQEVGYKRIFFVISDITNQVQADIAKKLEEERYSLTVKGINAGIWDWDIGKGTEWWSSKFYELLGYKDQEIPSGYHTFVNSLLHPDDRHQLLALGRQHRKEFTPYQMDIRLKNKSGDYRWFETFGESQRDASGQAIRMVGTIIDIHANKEALLTLKESEERFAQVFNYAPIGISLLSPDGTWLKVNRMLCEMVGYSKEYLQGRNFRDITHPDDLPRNDSLTEQLVRGEIDHFELEKRYIHRKGHEIWVLLRSTLIRDEAGNPQYGISQTLDISKRKEHEAEREKTIQVLNRQNNQLHNFAHIVSHNLRSHSANLQMLNDMYQDARSPEERALFFEKIKNIGDSLSTTIGDLSQIVKIAPDNNLPLEILFFADFFERVNNALQAEIMKTHARITTDFSDCPSITYPAVYLESILLNLLSNALKYRSPQRIPEITFRTQLAEGSQVLTCTDNGLGINLKKHRQHVFGLYKTFHRHPEARGMGLYLIRNQIESLGGTISVFSEPDKGTTFRVSF